MTDTITIDEARAMARRINAMSAKQEAEEVAWSRAFKTRREPDLLARTLGYIGCLIVGVGRLPGPLAIAVERRR